MRLKIPKANTDANTALDASRRSLPARIASVAVSAIFALSMLPVAAIADDEAPVQPEAPAEIQEPSTEQSIDIADDPVVEEGGSAQDDQPVASESGSEESEDGESADSSTDASLEETDSENGSEEAKTATVTINFKNALVTVVSQDGLNASNASPFQASIERDPRFDVVADDGFAIKEVTASNSNGTVGISCNGKTYTISADAVKAGGLSIDVVTVESDSDSAEEGESDDEGDDRGA